MPLANPSVLGLTGQSTYQRETYHHGAQESMTPFLRWHGYMVQSSVVVYCNLGDP